MTRFDYALRTNREKILAALGLGLMLALLVAAPSSQAAPGDLLAKVDLPVTGFGVSVGVDCDGNIYYTQGDTNLYKMDKDGNLLATIPITDSAGQSLTMDEMAWDNGRKLFWIQQHNSNPVRVYKLDPATGITALAFVSGTISVGSFRDGIAYDASDDTLWISGDVSTTIEHYRACDGGFINQITPTDSAGGNLNFISGVQAGVGDLLYLGRNGFTEIVRVKKSDGSFIGSFASPGGTRDEGLECDSVNFAPRLALWSRDVENFVVAIEVEDGTCACQSPCPKDIVVCNDPGLCGAVVTYTTPGQNTTCNPPSGSLFPVGTTTVTCTTINPACPDIPPATCTFTVTVRDCEAPRVICPRDIVVCNDPGLCSAVVTWNTKVSDNCPGAVLVGCLPASGSTFPKGTTTVKCLAKDAAGNTATCSFTVTVNDCEAPVAKCIPTTNPAGKTIPPASNTNPDGFYQLIARDNCDPMATLQIFIKDSAEGPCGGSFVAGPYAPGDKVKLTQSPGQASVKPMAGVIVAHINTRGDPVLVVTDSSGNTTTCQKCFVPPPPK